MIAVPGLITLAAVTAAWRPFLEPLDLHEHWMWLIIPVAIAIAVVYKALKLDDFRRLPWEATRLAAIIVAAMAVAAVALWALNELV